MYTDRTVLYACVRYPTRSRRGLAERAMYTDRTVLYACQVHDALERSSRARRRRDVHGPYRAHACIYESYSKITRHVQEREVDVAGSGQ